MSLLLLDVLHPGNASQEAGLRAKMLIHQPMFRGPHEPAMANSAPNMGTMFMAVKVGIKCLAPGT